MSAAYAKGVSDNLGNTQVMLDKLHFIQNVVEACHQIRKAERCANGGKRDHLERTHCMWLKNRANWTEKEAQKWGWMALERCVKGMAYGMRLVLQGIPTSGRTPWRPGGCSETSALGCTRCGENRRTTLANGRSLSDDRWSLGANLGLMDSRADDRFD